MWHIFHSLQKKLFFILLACLLGLPSHALLNGVVINQEGGDNWWQYSVLIQFADYGNPAYCTGFIYDNNKIATARHCADTAYSGDYSYSVHFYMPVPNQGMKRIKTIETFRKIHGDKEHPGRLSPTDNRPNEGYRQYFFPDGYYLPEGVEGTDIPNGTIRGLFFKNALTHVLESGEVTEIQVGYKTHTIIPEEDHLYDSHFNMQDFAILKLSEKIPTTHKSLPIFPYRKFFEEDKKDINKFASLEFFTAGFGQVNSLTENKERFFRYLPQKLVAYGRLDNRVPLQDSIAGMGQLVATSPNDEQGSSCYEDSGGPLFVKHEGKTYYAGVSLGTYDGQKTHKGAWIKTCEFGIFAPMSHFLPWLDWMGPSLN